MTDKIMVHGINVSECVCFAHYHTVADNKGNVILEIENSCVPKQKKCENIKNCCFKKLVKQLKKNEQECEDLKTKIFYYKKYEKERSETHKDTIHDLVLLKRYKQALDEIQQIVEFAMDEVLTLGQKNATAHILDIINKTRKE